MWGHLALTGSDPVIPDIMTMAKPLASGIPIGAVTVAKHLLPHFRKGDHGTTFGGNPFACHVASTVLDIIDTPQFLSTVQNRGAFLTTQLNHLQSKYLDIVKDVRGLGLMQGVELAPEVNVDDVVVAMRELGVLVCSAGGNVVRLVPPLVVSEAEITECVDVLDKALSETIKS
jgi:acetylornithine/succinyldiaminopimelate/putrescine aminotransferase